MLMSKRFQHTLGTKGTAKSAAQTLAMPGFPLSPEDPGSVWPPFPRVELAAVSVLLAAVGISTLESQWSWGSPRAGGTGAPCTPHQGGWDKTHRVLLPSKASLLLSLCFKSALGWERSFVLKFCWLWIGGMKFPSHSVSCLSSVKVIQEWLYQPLERWTITPDFLN